MGKAEGLADYARRFPALLRLASAASLRSQRVPFLQQTTSSDCGAAALGMTLGYFGRHVSLGELRDAVGWSKDGASASAILDAARAYGLRGRAVALDLCDLHHLPTGSILYWRFNHFVVLESVAGGVVTVLDPAFGRRRMPTDQLGKLFTGVALAFDIADGFERGGTRKPGVWALIRSLLAGSGVIGRIVVASALLQFLGLGLPLLTGVLVDRVLPQEDTDLLVAVAVGLGLVLLLHVCATLVRSHLLVHLRTFVDARLSLRFAERVLGAPYGFFHSRPPGDLMMRLNSNSTIREMLTTSALSAVLDGGLVLAYVVLLLAISPALAGVVLFLCLARIVAFVVVQRRAMALLAENLERVARSQSYEYEFLGAIEVIKAMGLEDLVLRRWSNLFVDTLNVNIQRGRLAAGFETYLSALDVASPLLILLFGARLVLAGALSLGMMLATNALALGILAPLSRLAETAGRLILIEAYLTRIDDVANEEGERLGGLRIQDMEGRIELAEVSFRHSSLASPVLDRLDLHILPGEHVAIVGHSGCGKSTLGRVLSGLYVPQTGTVSYDGHNLHTLDLRTLRRQLGVVTQETYLFSGDIRSNIAASDPTMPLERVKWAARIACIHEDIKALPMGYETVLADRGHSLSGGQRQRLALARSIAHRPPVLLLDEATSALDTILEERVYRNLRRLQATTIIIAHRLSTLLHADRIVVMDRGRIVEVGTHTQLIELGGTYAKLYEAQRDNRAGTRPDGREAASAPTGAAGGSREKELASWAARAGHDSH